MRESLGATKRERVLADNPWRRVVLVHDRDRGARIVRRIGANSPDAPDLVDRASALGLVRQVRIPGFALIEDRAIVGSTLEIAEEFVDGFTVGSHVDLVREQISVSVAIALVHQIARGLIVLHSRVEPSGHPAKLIHGRLGLQQIMLTKSGDVAVIGLEGARGDAQRDVADLLRFLHDLLVNKASSRAGGALLQRLAQLKFDSAEQMVAALTAYLDRQDESQVSSRRGAFVADVISKVRARGGLILHEVFPKGEMPEAPTELSRALGSSTTVEVQEDTDGPTITDAIPASVQTDSDTVQAAPTWVDRAARAGVLGPAASQKVEKKRPERAVSVGDYRVVASIGRGGMGEIYLACATGRNAGTFVALKVLGPEDSADEEALGMFIDEASIMARIDHPNVLRVVDFGRAKGRHFLAMEYLEGRPLVRVMIDAYQRDAGLDYGVIATVGADAARGLFAAHTATTPDGKPLRVVHRDISPQNIFVTYQGVTKVIDFGVARAAQRVSKTAVGVVKGKAAYMSPEQTEGREVDARSDVFSLGVCLWEMAAGRRLFKRETEYETLMAVSTAVIEKPSQVRGKPNGQLDKIILHALNRNREKRTQSADELARQLAEFAESSGKKDGHQAVGDLMSRLFGQAAAEERALIRSLVARAATDEEADSLRRLSGVSPPKGAKPEITLVGAPSALQELDHFGEQDASKPTAVPPPMPATEREPPPEETTSPQDVVLRAVEALKAKQGGGAGVPTGAPADGETPSQPILLENVIARLLPAIGEAATASDRASSSEKEKGPSGSEGSTAGAIVLGDDDFEIISSSSAAVPVSDPGGAPIIAITPAPELVPPEESTTAKRPALEGALDQGGRSTLRRWALYALAAAALALFALIGFFTSTNPTDEDETRITDVRSFGVVSTDTVARIGHTATVGRESGRGMLFSTREVGRSLSPGDAVETSTASLEAMLDELESVGLNVGASQGTFLLDDGRGGTVVVDREAEIVALSTSIARGWLVQTTRTSLTQVAWIGSVRGAPWMVRGLSVNDCAARARVVSSGVHIQYGDRGVSLPHGGGVLVDVSLDRPPFAERLEIEPLGLSFGGKDDSRSTVHCGVGWWGRQVVLRNLPEGRYGLRWSGSQQFESAPLEVGALSAVGGRIVRTSSIPR